MSLSHKDHIVNILREVRRGPNPGEDMKVYLERMADSILSYVPEEKKQQRYFGKKTEDKE